MDPQVLVPFAFAIPEHGELNRVELPRFDGVDLELARQGGARRMRRLTVVDLQAYQWDVHA